MPPTTLEALLAADLSGRDGRFALADDVAVIVLRADLQALVKGGHELDPLHFFNVIDDRRPKHLQDPPFVRPGFLITKCLGS